MKGINPRKDSRSSIANLWKREVGSITPRTFADSIRASEGIIRSLGIEKKLKEHKGCVNTLCFNTDGSILLSGSDDRRIILWDWDAGSVKHSVHTGHTDNILNAQFMPWSNDASIITCGADGQVRHVHLSEGATVRVLAEHLGDVHKMAIEPGSANTFYTCSEHGFVTRFDLRTDEPTELLSLKDASFYVRELYSIAIDPTNPYLTAVAGRDEAAHLYDFRKWGGSNSKRLSCLVGAVAPFELMPDNVDEIEITGLAFSNMGDLLVSYSHGDIYLFPREQVNSGFDGYDINQVKIYRGHSNKKTVKGVYFLGPGCEYVASGSDSGHASIWRRKDGEILRALKGDRHVVNCIEPHPLLSVLATSGINKDIKIWSPKSFEPDCSKKEVEMAAEMMDDTSSSDGMDSNLSFSMADSEDGSFYGSEDDEHSDGSDDDEDDDEEEEGGGGGGGGGGNKGDYVSEDEVQ